MADFIDHLSINDIDEFLVIAGSGRGSDFIRASDLMKLLPLLDQRRQVVTAMEVQDCPKMVVQSRGFLEPPRSNA